MDWFPYDRELCHERLNQRQGASAWFSELSLNLFLPTFPSDPPENIRKSKVFLRFPNFSGDQKRTLGRNALKKRITYSQDNNFGISRRSGTDGPYHDY